MVFLLLAAPAWSDSLRIKVLDQQGSAIPTARVTLGVGVTLRPGADGTLTTEAALPATIRVSAPGFLTFTKTLAAAPADEIVVELHPSPVYSTVDVVVRPHELEVGPAVANSIEIGQTGARTVFDAVDKLVPSAFVTRRGVMGYGISTNGTGGVSIRGVGNSPNTGLLVVIDGRPDYMGMMGHPLPDFYSLTDAESVSVTKGPASVLYGTNAMGGAINIKPADPVERFQTELSASLGSYWTGQYRLKHGGGFPKWFYNVTSGVDHTNGDRPVSHFRNQDGSVAIGYTLSSVWRTSLRGRYGHFVVEDPGVVGLGPGPWASVGRGGFSWNADNSGDRVWGSTRVFGSWGHHHIDDGWRSNDRTVGGRVHQNILLAPTLLLDAGGDLADYGGVGRNVNAGVDYGRRYGTSAAGFSRLHWTPGRRIHLNTGLRTEHNSIFGWVTVPEFGASIGLTEGYSLNFNVARGFRNPTIRELYLFPAPNPNLQPEHMWNYQATLLLQPAKALSASLTAYYADLDNMIVTTGRWPNLALNNAGKTLNRGVEADARWRIGRRFSIRGGYAWLRSTNLAPYIPAHKATYALEVNLRRAFLYIGGVTVSNRWADTSKTTELSGYTLPTLKIVAPVNRRLEVFATVDNLSNSSYEVITGYPMPGVNAAGGLTLKFR